MKHHVSATCIILAGFICGISSLTVRHADAHSLGNQAAARKQKEEQENAKRLQTARQLEEALAKAATEEELAKELGLLENLMSQEMATTSRYSFRKADSLRKAEKDILRESIDRLNDYLKKYSALCTTTKPCDKTITAKARRLVKRYAPELPDQRP